jgi:hypothetical protein
MPDDKTYVDKDLFVYDVVERSREAGSRLDGFTFLRCRITGPAILAPCGNFFILEGSSYTTACAKALFWEVTTAQRKIGAIAVRDCSFFDCSFDDIGFAGSRDLLDLFLGPQGSEMRALYAAS